MLGILVLSGIGLLPVLLPIAATDDSLKSTRATASNGTFRDLTSYTWDMLKYSTLPFMIWMDSSISFILSGHRLSNDQDDLDIC